MISAAEIEKRDTVLEVGSGVGNITSSLTGKADRVVAVEKNPKFIPILKERFGNRPNLDLIMGDALRVQLPRFDKVVSNLPYSICEAFLQRLTRCDFSLAALITSTSFAKRITAKEGNIGYTKLSLISRTFFDVEYMEEVSAKAYYPEPRHSTSIIRIKTRKASAKWESILRGVLVQGDKKLMNALREAMIVVSNVEDPLTKRAAKAFIETADLGSMQGKRVARLSLRDLQRLSKILKSIQN